MTFSKMTLSMMYLIMTLTMNDSQHNDTWHKTECHHTECRYSVCWVSYFLIVVLKVIVWMSLCWVSLCWMSLCWVLWRLKNNSNKHHHIFELKNTLCNESFSGKKVFFTTEACLDIEIDRNYFEWILMSNCPYPKKCSIIIDTILK